MVRAGDHPAILLVAPLAVPSLPLARALTAATAGPPDRRGPGGRLAPARLASVAATCDLDSLQVDLFGDDLLRERGIVADDQDNRSVGEVLAQLVGHADFVLTAGATPQTAQAGSLLDHVRAADSHLITDFLAGGINRLFDHSHSCQHATSRIDPLRPVHNGAPEREGVWTMHLQPRPARPPREIP